jgi:hypothetical protein
VGSLAYQHTFNRFTTRMTLNAHRLDYNDSTQEFRNRWSSLGELRGAYELRNGLSLVATGYYGRDDYHTTSTLVDSAHTVGGLLGAHLTLPELLDFELSAGRFKRSYDDNRGELSGLTIRGSMAWQPTRLTTVNAEVLREDDPTQVLGLLAKIRTDVSLQIDHSYSPRLSLYARGRVILDDYHAITHTDITYIAEAGMNFLMTRHFVVSLTYDHGSRSSYVRDRSFQREIASLTLTGRF